MIPADPGVALVFESLSRSTTRLSPVSDTSKSSRGVDWKVFIDPHSPVITAHTLEVGKLEKMLGSYASSSEAYTRNFEPEEFPSGILARIGTFSVRSRVIDDDGEVFASTCYRFHTSNDQT